MINKIKTPDILIKLVITSRIWKNKLLFFHERRLLHFEKQKQKILYEKLKTDFNKLYKKIKRYPIRTYVTPFWQDSNKKMERVLLPYPAFDFFNNPNLLFLMFMTSGGNLLKKELNYLENKIKKPFLKKIIREEYFGSSLILNREYISSHNSIHHLYHLLKYEERTGKKLSNNMSIVEWGGGYGNLAKIFRRYTKRRTTYIIVDTPLFSCMQWLYLSIALGSDEVSIISNPNEKIINGRVNILPLGLIKYYTFNADLFVSTWGLSESTKDCQLFVKDKKFFGSKNFLLAFHKSTAILPDSDFIRSILPKDIKIEKNNLMKGNFYAFS